MPLPIAIPLAISAIKALLRFRDQVDTILSLNEATTGLPFALPPPPTDNAPYLPAMRSFFQAGDGQTDPAASWFTKRFRCCVKSPDISLTGDPGSAQPTFHALL